MATQEYVDGVLLHYGERLLWDGSSKGKPNQQSRELSRVGRALGAMAAPSPATITPEQVRMHVQNFVRRTPQVMLKVTGGGTDMRRVAAHIDYIARGGRYKKKGEEELELETETGEVFKGADARAQLHDEWEFGGDPIPRQVDEVALEDGPIKKPKRQALNLILSMPPGVDRELVKFAARETVREIFGEEYQYVMAHHSDTDKQHAHVSVKMMGRSGKRLNPRKADLERWRELFARNLNKRGVAAVSTRRKVRLQRAKGDKQAVYQMKARGATPRNLETARAQGMAAQKAKDNATQVTEAYQHISDALAKSPDSAQRALSLALQQRLLQEGIRLKKPASDIAPSAPLPKMGI